MSALNWTISKLYPYHILIYSKWYLHLNLNILDIVLSELKINLFGKHLRMQSIILIRVSDWKNNRNKILSSLKIPSPIHTTFCFLLKSFFTHLSDCEVVLFHCRTHFVPKLYSSFLSFFLLSFPSNTVDRSEKSHVTITRG